MSLKVSIVEDNRGTRLNIEELLNGSPNLRCLAAYATGEAAVRDILNDRPDVALVDINLPGISGIECVRMLKEKLPALQILMLTAYDEADMIFDSLRAGAAGYLLKKTLSSELIPAIEQVSAGGAPMSMQIARKVVEHFRDIRKPASDVERLTPREQEILALLANGNFYKEISTTLGITLNTVKVHVQHIYEKLHVQCRMDAVRKFRGQQ